MSSLSIYEVSLLGLQAWLLYLIIVGVYRIYFHPLAKFPGPKIAALTKWYEFYHDIVHKGCFLWKLQELHDHYGIQCSYLATPSGIRVFEIEGLGLAK